LYQNPGEHTKDEAPRLLVDAMLGRLARWLRLLGCDAVLAPNDATDMELVRRARAEGRTILTRDTALARRRGVAVLLVASMELTAQLRQVVGQLGIGRERIGTRCLVCNHELVSLSREDARGRVPLYVWETQHQFHYCPQCDRVYWAGTHWEQMRARLDAILDPDDRTSR